MEQWFNGADATVAVTLNVRLVEGDAQLRVGVPLGFGWWHPFAVFTAFLSCRKTGGKSCHTNKWEKKHPLLNAT